MKKNDQLIEHDAVEFGAHVRLGGWRLGLLVARSVETDKGRGQSRSNGAAEPFKVSAREFAEMSGTTHGRVMRYLKAWDAAATDGYVPESALLVPGEELDGMEDLPAWETFYSWEASRTSAETLDRYTAAAEEEGTTSRTTVSVAQNKKAIRAAIKADPAVALAAREALAERDIKSRDRVLHDPFTPKPSTMDDFARLVIDLQAAKRNLQSALTLTLGIHGFRQQDRRDAIAAKAQELRAVLDAIEEAAAGRSMDEELQQLLEEGAL